MFLFHNVVYISFLIRDRDYKPQPFEVKLNDFDNSSFYIQVPEHNLNQVNVSLELPCYKEIKTHGSQAAIEAAFGAYLQPEAEPGYDVTVSVTQDAWTGKEEQTIELLSKLKHIALGGIFDFYLSKLNQKQTAELSNFKFQLRPDTIVYFIPFADRIQITFQLSFIDKADMEIGRVFLTEFADPSLRRKVQRAPLVNFEINPPSALKAFGVGTPNKSDLGFVSFTILELHCADAVRPKAVESLQVFRNFVQYHLKCAKSYFHSRMRMRVAEFVKVLNRAKTTLDSNQPKRITTAAGRTLIK